MWRHSNYDFKILLWDRLNSSSYRAVERIKADSKKLVSLNNKETQGQNHKGPNKVREKVYTPCYEIQEGKKKKKGRAEKHLDWQKTTVRSRVSEE